MSALCLMIIFALACVVLGLEAQGGKVVKLPLWGVLDGRACATNITVGSNKDTASVLVYTNSFGLSINPSCGTTPASRDCQSNTSYSPTESKSAKRIESPGSRYVYSPFYDGSNGIGSRGNGWFYGNLYTDTFEIGDAEVESLGVVIATEPRDMSYGELGLLSNDSALIDILAAQGHISTKTFALQLPSLNNTEGSLIFGGFDKKKYSCALAKTNLSASSHPLFGRYRTRLTSIGQTTSNESIVHDAITGDEGLEVALSSELIYNVFPEKIFMAIGTTYPNATFVNNTESEKRLFKAPCKAPEGSIDLFFGLKQISITYQDFVEDDGKGGCWLKMVTRVMQHPSLGASFFRAAYLVFDLDNNALWLAQAANCGSELMAIVKGEAAAHIEVEEGCQCGRNGDEPKTSNAPTTGTPTGIAKVTPTRINVAVRYTSWSLSALLIVILSVIVAIVG